MNIGDKVLVVRPFRCCAGVSNKNQWYGVVIKVSCDEGVGGGCKIYRYGCPSRHSEWWTCNDFVQLRSVPL